MTQQNTLAIATPDELKAAFAEWQEINRQMQQAENKQAGKLAALKAKHDSETAPLAERMAELETRIKAYAAAHQTELTGGKGKAAAIGTGFIKWRSGRDSVQISSDTETVIAELKRRRLSRLIRVKEEINKTAVLADAAVLAKRPINGLQIVKGSEEIVLQA